MKVTAPQVVWQAKLGQAHVRAVLQPKEVLEFEHSQEDAIGEKAWITLATDETAGLEREAEERFMLDLLQNVATLRAENDKLTTTRDHLRKRMLDAGLDDTPPSTIG